MRCNEVMELLLEADPGALAAGNDEGLAAHLDGCPSCRGEWLALQDAHGHLASGIAALETHAAKAHHTPGRPTVPSNRVPPAWRRSTTAGLLALAAGLAGVLWLGGEGDVMAPFDPPRGVEMGLAGPLVRADSHDNVAVLTTGNPDIAVIWFF